jgi:hypothetical protein
MTSVTPVDNMNLAEDIGALRPRGELSKYCDFVQSPVLFPQFVAVVAGLKPGMDCWVAVDRYEEFNAFVRGVGLSLAVDCAFRKVPLQMRDQVVGFDRLCTTYALGIPSANAEPEDTLHVFIGKNIDVVNRMRACGWYPVIVNGRVHDKPFVDHVEFGRALGYPECCVKFFMRSNNWNRTNSYAESLLSTHSANDYRTNCFGKNFGYSLNFHIPCRFDCSRTIEDAAKLEQFLGTQEPDYAAACRRLLHLPVVSLNEREVVLLDGVVGNRSVKYSSALDLFMTPAEIMNALRRGNLVEMRGRFLAVFQDTELIDIFECRCDQFGPKVPLLLTWS